MMLQPFLTAIKRAAQRTPTPAARRSLDDARMIGGALFALAPVQIHEHDKRSGVPRIRYASDYGPRVDVPGPVGPPSQHDCTIHSRTGISHACPLTRECMAMTLRGGPMHPNCGQSAARERGSFAALWCERKATALAYVTAHPGCRRGELCEALGLEPQTTRDVMQLLRADGSVCVKGRGYYCNTDWPDAGERLLFDTPPGVEGT